ncbi:MAG TPA: MauE/DoxX family redox-associated membrane protein [Bryobacteraceae bacterium]|nr:MauE/DoxX family redox-associated membrane protein [Bryobacteraceae bacterium]
MESSRSKALYWTALALRVIVGGVFAYAGYLKLREPWALFAMGIDSYHILPYNMVVFAAHTLPAAEVALGLWLMVGFWPRIPASVISLLLMVFFTAMVHAKMAGQKIDCGCFGTGDPISKWTLLRDGSLLAASLFATWVAFRRLPKKA